MLPTPIRARTIDDFMKLITRLQNGKLISIKTLQNRHEIVIENKAALNSLFCYAADFHLYDTNELEEFAKTASDIELNKIEIYNQHDHLISLKTLKDNPTLWQTLKPTSSITDLLSDLNYTHLTSYEMPAIKTFNDIKSAYVSLEQASLHKSAFIKQEFNIDYVHPTYAFTRPSLLKADILRLILLSELSLRKRLANAKMTLTESKAVPVLNEWITEINNNTKTSKDFIQHEFDRENHKLSTSIANREAAELVLSDKTLVTHKNNLKFLKEKLANLLTAEIDRNKSARKKGYAATTLITISALLTNIAIIVAVGIFFPIAAVLLFLATLAVTLLNFRAIRTQLKKLSTYLELKFVNANNTIPAQKKNIQDKINNLDTNLILAEVFSPIPTDQMTKLCTECKLSEIKSSAITADLAKYLKEIELQDYLNSSNKKNPSEGKPLTKSGFFARLSKPSVTKKIHAGAELGVKSIAALRTKKEAG